jgi:hypothetical protein
MDKLRYPIGEFVAVQHLTNEDRKDLISQLPSIVDSLRDIVNNLSTEQLQLSYRPGGWTIQQVIHHMADNDLNAYLRLKRALTEDQPQASSYREDLWAEMDDYKYVPVETSLLLMQSLHSRLYVLLKGLPSDDFKRTFHTSVLGKISIDIALQRFVWHNRHHTEQVRLAIGEYNNV